MKEITKNLVKFAILTLKAKDPRSKKTLTRGKIVSKCFLLETRELHYPDGEVEKSYLVNFPFRDISTYENTMFTAIPSIGEPDFDSQDRVDKVFDTYEDALAELETVNRNIEKLILIKSQLLGDNWKDKYAKTMQLLKKNNAICSLFEERVSAATTEMIVEEKEKLKIKVD